MQRGIELSDRERVHLPTTLTAPQIDLFAFRFLGEEKRIPSVFSQEPEDIDCRYEEAVRVGGKRPAGLDDTTCTAGPTGSTSSVEGSLFASLLTVADPSYMISI